ncbi:Retrovirus-related Pol polyprotein from transposon RE1 [Vitis vinifera]|uniref:Retrovirus-related Pol polyprotein from transposon RE1 n=1 Tax=Vitis vinifera TaxID=29760 RepID=A0A438EE42_VITVI|nr:Retrovirus-related Pol polyprotein from transposon RE1 [Vitis vinifera]
MLWHYCTGAMTIAIKGASEEDAVFLSRMIEWDSHNHMILTWIRNTSIPSIPIYWAASTMQNLHGICWPKGQSINDYYDQLRFIWDQIDLSDPTWACSKDAQQYASIRDEFRLYEFLMSLHKDFEPIRGQLLNRSPAPSLDTVVNELSNLSNQVIFLALAIVASRPTKKFCNYCKRPGHTIETCYRRNKSTAVVANTEPTPSTASTSVESQSSGSTINLSSTELQENIAQAVRMAGNASLSTALSVLPGFVSTSNLSVPGVFHDPRTGQELRTGPRVGRMFPVNNLHLPPVAPISIAAAAAAVSSLPSLAFWHSRLGHAPSSRFLSHFGVKLVFMLFMAINRIPSAVIHNQTSYECLFGSTPDYHHLRSFGSACFVLLQPHEHNKLEPRSRLCCFLGYGETQKGYFDVSPRQVADEQIDDELPHFEPGSPAPALLKILHKTFHLTTQPE